MLRCGARLFFVLFVGLGALVAVPAAAWAQTGYPPAPATTLVGPPPVLGGPTVAGGRPVPAESLSFTGGNHVYGLSELAAGLAVGGAVLVFVTRRRRDAAQLR